MRLILLVVIFWASAARAQTSDIQNVVVSLINKHRLQQGLVQLEVNSKLNIAAQSQADYMIRVGRMEHLQGSQPPNGGSYQELKQNWNNSDWHPVNRVLKAEYMPFEKVFTRVVKDGREAAVLNDGIYNLIGENVAYGRPGAQGRFSPNVIVQGWMNSPGHRKAILNPSFNEIGVGYATTPNKAIRDKASAWCTVFANQK